MKAVKKTLYHSQIWLLSIIMLTAFSCKKLSNVSSSNHDTKAKVTIQEFAKETGINANWIPDNDLLKTVKSSQGSEDYPGVDDWATATIPAGLDLYGGLPGQSAYYSIKETLVKADTMQIAYWESLQVKAHPQHGYRQNVGIFDLDEKTTVAIARTLANPQYGAGGAWQIYVKDYKTILSALDTIALIK